MTADWCVATERLRAPDSSSSISDQQSVGLSPTRVLEQDSFTKIALFLGLYIIPLPL